MKINNFSNLFYGIVIAIIFFIISYDYYNKSNLLEKKLSWDESHYVIAANKGIVANSLSKDSLSFIQFLQISFFKIKNNHDPDSLLFDNFPEEKNDPFILRQLHPVFPVYIWSFFNNADKKIQVHRLRISNIVLLSFLIFVLILFSFKLNNLSFLNFGIVFSVILFFFWNDIILRSFEYLNFHTYYSLMIILHIYFFIRFIKKNNFVNLLLFSFFSALLIMTLETYVFTFISLIISIFFINEKKILTLKNIIYFTLIVFLTLLIFWPSIIYTLDPIKNHIINFYKIFIISDEFKGIFFITKWKNLLINNIESFILIFVLFFYSILNFKHFSKLNYVPFIYGIVYFVFMSSFMHYDTYILPSWICFIYGSLLILSNIYKNNLINYYLKLLLPFVFFIIFLFNYYNYNFKDKIQSVKEYNNDLNQIVELIQSKDFINKNILIDAGHIFKYYSDHKNIYELEVYDYDNPGFFIRENYIYNNIEEDIKDEFFKIIAIKKVRKYSKSSIEFLLKNNYELQELSGYNVFILKT